MVVESLNIQWHEHCGWRWDGPIKHFKINGVFPVFLSANTTYMDMHAGSSYTEYISSLFDTDAAASVISRRAVQWFKEQQAVIRLKLY